MNKLNVDCLYLIFYNNLDRISLFPCLLVNKEWCNIVVPILWKTYSGYPLRHEEKMDNTILSCLLPSSKQLLSDNNIKLPSTILSNPPLFNYISFCEFPNTYIINKIVQNMFEEKIYENTNSCNLLEQEIYKLFVSQCKDIKELYWDTSQPLPLFPGALACFSQLCYLCIDANIVNSNSMYEMARICKDLNNLVINNCQDLPGLISLVDAQRNLKCVTIIPNKDREETCKELGKALTRKRNAINYLDLHTVRIIPPSFLTLLVNLKRFYYYKQKNYEDTKERIEEFQHYLTILEFPDLERLSVERLSCFKELAMLIERTKGNI